MSSKQQKDFAAEARNAGRQCVAAHPVLAPLLESCRFGVDAKHQFVSAKGWLAVSPGGMIWFHPKRRAEPEAWARFIAVALICLGFGLVRRQEPYALWELASFLVADRFCDELKLGQLPEDLLSPEPTIPSGGAEALLRQFCVDGCEPALQAWYSMLCGGEAFFCSLDEKENSWQRRPRWRELLADGIAGGVGRALQVDLYCQP